MKKIIAVIGARPQFIKHCPVEIALKKNFNILTVHTGQHYDDKMSNVFFEELNLAKPAYNLNVGSHSHGMQTSIILQEVEKIIMYEKPYAVLVYGDTNSTLAAALAAVKLHFPVIHVEAGLRSYNKKMPEEINRVATDHVSDLLFAPTNGAVKNLEKENITKGVYNIGDVMCDMLRIAKKKIDITEESNQILLTLHRPYNVDDPKRLIQILKAIKKLPLQCIFPVHPRTLNVMKMNGISLKDYENIIPVQPLSYFEMIKALLRSVCVITDSGGVQKEAYILKKKCITLRSETEWVETLEGNWNMLVYDNLEDITNVYNTIPGKYNEGVYGNGFSSNKILEILKNIFL